MVKFILKEADENSPIYKAGFILSPLKLNKSKKIRQQKNYCMKWFINLNFMVLRSKVSLRIIKL